MRPYVIGIGGASCSGKSVLATHLAGALPGEATVVPMDAYYRDLSGMAAAERAEVNFDEPAALDHDLLARQLRRLASGEAADKPVYEFATHTRSATAERVQPGEFLVLEGLFALTWSAVRSELDLKVFVSASDALCLERRLRRDVADRGRTAESVREQFVRTVQPMAVRHIQPTRRYADIVVRGDAPVAQAVAAVLDCVRKAGTHGGR